VKYRIEPPGWRVAGVLLPAGTIINTDDADCIAKELTIPINATPLDQAAWDAQLAAYGEEYRHLLRGGWR